MAEIVFDNAGEKFYYTGIEKVTLGIGNIAVDDSDNDITGVVAWNGVTNVSDSPSGAEPTDLYADNIKWMTMLSNEEQSSTIEAYMYPDEWEQCNGYTSLGNGVKIGQQRRKKFSYTYQTKQVDDDGNEHEILHIMYNGLASPSEEADNTINDSPEATTFSWEISHTPVKPDSDKSYSTGLAPFCNIEIDLTALEASTGGVAKRAAVEALVYGSVSASAKIPSLDSLYTAITA